MVKGADAPWGTLKCGCHPDCGISSALMVSKKTKKWAPLPAFVNIEKLFKDIIEITDQAPTPKWAKVQTGLGLLRNYNPMRVPEGFSLLQLLKKFDIYNPL